jgi:flagellar biosynthesis GTPase FlhF
VTDVSDLEKEIAVLKERVAADKRLFIALALVILAALGYTNFVSVPAEANNQVNSEMPEAVKTAFRRWLEDNNGDALLSELERTKRTSEELEDRIEALVKRTSDSASTAEQSANNAIRSASAAQTAAQRASRESNIRFAARDLSSNKRQETRRAQFDFPVKHAWVELTDNIRLVDSVEVAKSGRTVAVTTSMSATGGGGIIGYRVWAVAY